MVYRLIDWSLDNRFLVMILAIVLLGAGAYSVTHLPLDAVPDLTNTQVQVLTTSPALGPVEIEQFITFPVEMAMSGLPGVTDIRSISRFGLSAVTVIFEDGTDIYWARNLVNERLQQARESIPDGMGDPQMGPIATGMSEIYQFEVRAEEGYDYDLMELRTILDWQIAFQLRSVPGVTEVNTFGGELKTYEIRVDPLRLQRYDISLTEVLGAVNENNANSGGGYIADGAEQQLIRGEGLVGSIDDVKNIVVQTREGGTPILVSDLGDVVFAPMLRQGAVTRDGDREAVTGMVMMLMGGNSRQVVADVKEKIATIEQTLPEGVVIDTFYDRTELVDKTIHTIAENIGGGVFLVIVMLFLLLGDIRAGLIVAAAIPLSAMCALIAMNLAGVSANLMSLGAIDFGVIVDGAVVMVENIVRRASAYQARHGTRVPKSVFRDASHEVGKPILFAGMIVIIVFLPILSLEGVEGKMFRPMAFTFMTALTAALILAVTVAPVMASLFLARSIQEKETRIVRWMKQAYRPLLSRSMAWPRGVVAVAALAFLGSVLLASRFGLEFVPKLDEGDLAIQATRLPSVSLEASLDMTKEIEATLLEFPEVITVVSKTGRPEIANDPMGVHQTDIIVRLHPPGEWPKPRPKEDLIAAMQTALEERVPSNAFSFTQPIELRVQELVAGVRSDVGLSLYGDDLAVLEKTGDEIARVLSQVPGAADVQAQQVAGLPYLRVKIRRDQIARHGISAQDVLQAVSAVGGIPAGEVYEGQRRFPIQVRLAPESREDVDTLRRLTVTNASGQPIPISQLADIIIEDGPSEISREALKRRILIQSNVRGRDLAGFVEAAKQAVAENVQLPTGSVLTWGGQFENLERASNRLMIAVPVALFLIFALLYLTFNSVKLALLIYLNVPIATTGGILALWVRDMPFSISAGVGFIALFGIAVMNGVVLIEHIRHLRIEGLDQHLAVEKGAMDRLRPVIMTASCGALGFVPMALSTSSGAEVQRPLATVVIGGLITSTILTLLVLPAIYRWFEPTKLAHDDEPTSAPVPESQRETHIPMPAPVT